MLTGASLKQTLLQQLGVGVLLAVGLSGIFLEDTACIFKLLLLSKHIHGFQCSKPS